MSHLKFYFPIPDDEAIYSIITRYAILSGYSGANVMHQIFGNRRKRVHPYIPGLIERIADFFDLNAEDVIINRTIFPLLRFTQPLDTLKIKATMLSQPDDKVLLTTALVHSKFRIFYGLNCCPLCIKQDKAKWGFSYWHVHHQIPGTQVCYRHDCSLHSIRMGDGKLDRSLFLPPDIQQMSLQPTTGQIIFAHFANDLFTMNQTEELNYKASYQWLLTNRGLRNPKSGRLKMNSIISLIKEYWNELPFSDHFQSGIPESLADFDFLGGMLRKKSHSYCHPIKHILLACWLTDGNTQNLQSCKTIQKQSKPIKTYCKNSENSRILVLLKQGLSINRIYKITGRSRCYIRRVAELNNIPHLSNKLSFSKDLRRSVLIKALYGIHRKDIALALGVSIGFVEQAISNEQNMSLWRKHLMVRKRVMLAYRKLEELKRKYPMWNRTEIRKHNQSAYFLLYNNARSLIEKVMPSPLQPKPYKHNWQSEDTRIYNALIALGDITSLSLSELDRRVNGHGNLLRKRQMLPKSSNQLSTYRK